MTTDKPTYIFLDTETTGVEEQDEVIQLAFITSQNKQTLLHNAYAMPGTPISTGAMAVHHITPEKLALKSASKLEATKEYRILRHLASQPDNVIFAHNAKFDLDMLKKHHIIPNCHIVDTLRIVKTLFPKQKSHALQYTKYEHKLYLHEPSYYQKLGIDSFTLAAHDARTDVAALYILCYHLLIRHLSVEKMIEVSSKPVLEETIRFGKHKDKLWAEVPYGYLKWMKSNLKTLTEDQQFTLDYWLDWDNRNAYKADKILSDEAAIVKEDFKGM